MADNASGYKTPAPFSAYLKTLAGPDRDPVLFDDPEDLLVRRFELTERLHAPYVLDISLFARNPEIDVPGLVGGDFELFFHKFDSERSVRGVVLDALYRGSYDHKVHLQLRIGPALSLLRMSRRSRIFQNLNVISIAEEVVGRVFSARSRKLNASLLDNAKYPVRDYCVQFREDDLTFLHRILAEEGITFVFDHSGDSEELILLPDQSVFVPVGSSFTGGAGGDYMVPVATGLARAQTVSTEEWIRRFEWAQEHTPAKAQTDAWDWKSSRFGLFSAVEEAPERHPWVVGEDFEHEARRTTEKDRAEGDLIDETKPLATRLLRRGAVLGETFEGTSTMSMMTPGNVFTPTGHPHPHIEGAFYVTRVVHRGECPEVDESSSKHATDSGYVNEFQCVRADVPFAPPLSPKPRVFGPQTAVVVGPNGEEICTDPHGRIKVRMHFDREQASQEADTSCWIRVAQSWAGPGWGALFIPRVGMEVIVQFLDGDPDRPLVAGAVYNAQNPPPYTLPDERTKSTVKSSSSPGGKGFNEFRFEDAAGGEQIFLHAQKDLSEVVLDAHDMTVGTTQTIDVGSDQKVTIGGNRSLSVTGNHVIHIKSDPPSKEGEPPPTFKGQDTLIDGDMKTVIKKTAFIHATDKMELKVGGDAIFSILTILPGSIQLTVNNGSDILMNTGIVLQSQLGGASLALTAAKQVTLMTQDGCTFAMDSKALMSTLGGAELSMSDAVAVSAPNDVSFQSKTSVAIEGALGVELAASPTKMNLTPTDAALSSLVCTFETSSKMGSIQLGPAGVSLDGLSCDITGKAMVGIKGMLVGINS